MGSVLKVATRFFNPIAMPIAASGLIPAWGVIRHTGRRSGRQYATPIALMATADSFVIPLAWGERTDWSRNVVAAKRATVRWRGRDHDVDRPQLLSRDVGAAAFPRPLRALLPLFHVHGFLHVRRVDAAERAA